jgi:hypothetical protein
MEALSKIIERPLRLLGEYQVECVLIGGVAASLHGSTLLTNDVDVCYSRKPENLARLANALQSVNAHLRNAPLGIPFLLDSETLRRGLNFTFATDIGSLDLLGEVRGVGLFEDAAEESLIYELFGYSFRVISLQKLIDAKRAAGRPKDLIMLSELEALSEG